MCVSSSVTLRSVPLCYTHVNCVHMREKQPVGCFESRGYITHTQCHTHHSSSLLLADWPRAESDILRLRQTHGHSLLYVIDIYFIYLIQCLKRRSFNLSVNCVSLMSAKETVNILKSSFTCKILQRQFIRLELSFFTKAYLSNSFLTHWGRQYL